MIIPCLVIPCLVLANPPSTETPSDSLENLIEKEQVIGDDWPEESVRPELPPVRLKGTAGEVQIMGLALSKTEMALCTGLEVDELIELSHEKPGASRMVINTSLSQVRGLLEDSCLIRPGDEIFAVGRGSQRRVRVGQFIARAGAGYSLWMSVDPPLEEDPLFYTTDLNLGEGSNQYLRVDSFESGTLSELLNQKVGQAVPFLDEFAVTILRVGDVSLQELVVLKRRDTTPEDDKLANMVLLGVRNSEVLKIWEEPVNIRKGSGTVSPEGLLDFNQDGLVDLEIRVSRPEGAVVLVLQGTKTGWTPIEIPDILP